MVRGSRGHRSGWIGCALLAPALVLALAQAKSVAQGSPPAKLALTNARIISVSGADIARGTVLVEHGVIRAVGETVELPYDAIEVDCGGRVVFPGLIDPHSARGLDVPNENLPVAPFLDVYDAVDPSRLFFEDSLRDGVTTVHVIQGDNCVIGGTSRAMRPIGLTPDEMTLASGVALKLSTTPKAGFDRMRQMGVMREAFAELDRAALLVAEKKYEESLKKEGKPLDVGPGEARERGRPLVQDSDYEDRHLNLVRLRRGDLSAWFACQAATDVGPALRIATDQGFVDRTALVLGPEAFKAWREIKASGRPVVLDETLVYREKDEATGRVTETFIPSVFHEAGIPFALQPNPDGSLAERYLTYQAALCVRRGIPRQAAIEAVTLAPARMLGLGDRLGSIEPGKIADLVVYSGDPLAFDSWVESVYIDGVLAYERSKDVRLQELLRLTAPPPTPSPEQAASPSDQAPSEPAPSEPAPSDPAPGDPQQPAPPGGGGR